MEKNKKKLIEIVMPKLMINQNQEKLKSANNNILKKKLRYITQEKKTSQFKVIFHLNYLLNNIKSKFMLKLY